MHISLRGKAVTARRIGGTKTSISVGSLPLTVVAVGPQGIADAEYGVSVVRFVSFL